jgi:hypothetical protein
MGKKSKDKWLSKNSTWLNVIVSKNSDDSADSDGSNSEDDSKSGSDDSKSGSESEEEEETGGTPKFLPKDSGKNFKFSKKIKLFNTQAVDGMV